MLEARDRAVWREAMHAEEAVVDVDHAQLLARSLASNEGLGQAESLLGARRGASQRREVGQHNLIPAESYWHSRASS